MDMCCPFPGCSVKLIEKGGDKYVYWECPDCGARLSPGPGVDIWKLEQQYKHSLASKKGGSKKVGRKRERPHLKKKYPWGYEA